MRRFFFSTAVVLLFTAAYCHLALARTWEADKPHTNFYFEVDHIFAKVRGQFDDYLAEIVFDPEDLANSRFYFEIKVASVDTNILQRDRHLQSTDFFDAERYPTMTFTSKKVTDEGGGRYEVAGILNIKGVDYKLVLPLTLAGIKEHPAVKGREILGLNGALTIDRLEYKIGTGKFFDLGVVGRKVEILVSIEALSDR